MPSRLASNALKWIFVALLAASLFVGVAIVLARWRARLPAPTIQVPIDNVAMPLDASGAGMQIVANTVLSATLQPWPPRANTPSSLTLIATDWTTHAAREVTPTLEIAPHDQVDSTTFTMMRVAPGRYESRGVFFPSPGPWRVRVRMTVADGEPYTMLIVADVP